MEHDSIISWGDSFNESEKSGLLKVQTLTQAFKPMNSIQIDKTPTFWEKKNGADAVVNFDPWFLCKVRLVNTKRPAFYIVCNNDYKSTVEFCDVY